MSDPPADRLIALVGLPGSGKSAVGRRLAERLSRPFIDLDDSIQERTGRDPETWFATEGEQRFREVESTALADAVSVPRAVVATGGGSVIDPRNRIALADAATVVWLDAPDEELLARLARSDMVRPLLRATAPGGAAAALAAMRATREPFYRASDIHVDATDSVDSISDHLAAVLADTALPAVPRRVYFDGLFSRSHPNGPTHARVVFGSGLDATALRSILDATSLGAPLVVADERVAAALPGLVGSLPGARQLTLRGGEPAKRLRVVERLLEDAAALGMERTDAWIAVGGGVTGDVVGTAAALYHRGAPLVHVPTTWLAQADSAIGGKVAVDLSRAKNAAGAFWPPVAVIADTATLRTLPRARLLDGMAESLKCGLIGDPQLWGLIEAHGKAALDPAQPDEASRYAIVEGAARLKLGVVERDPYERGERRNLNLGHTIGHALEVESGYRLTHGQAVILGLRAVASISVRRGAELDLAPRIDALVSSLGYAMHRQFDRQAVRTALSSDKKRIAGRQRWILPMEVGRVIEVDDVTEAELDLALRTIASTRAGERAAA